MTTANNSSSLAIDAPGRSANDEAITIRVTGAEPDATVQFDAALTDADGVEWRSTATFTADGDGTVDLSRDAPEAAKAAPDADAGPDADADEAPDAPPWTGVEPMAWLWAMTSDADAPFARFGDRATIDVHLHAETTDDATDRTITRVLHDEAVRERPVDADGVVGTLYLPADDGPHHGIIELHGSGGRRSDGTAKRLASHGYATLSLTYFGDDHDALPDELERVPLSYADDAADWLRDQPEVRNDQVGLVGSSRGAEFALLLAAHRDWVGAVVSFAGSGVPWDTPSGEPAWTRDGDPVPHIEADEHPTVTDLDDRDLHGNAPPIENAAGPILLLSGREDNIWNASRLSDVVVARLEGNGFPHDYDHRTYDDCGHLIGRPYAPLAGIEDVEHARGTPKGTVRASEDAWPAVLDTLEDGLQKNE